MLKIKVAMLLCLFAITVSGYSQDGWGVYRNTAVSQQNGTSMSFELMINSNSKIEMQNVPTVGYLEVFSILGVRVRYINLKDCVGGYSVELPKGIYILKAGKTAIKVVAR